MFKINSQPAFILFFMLKACKCIELVIMQHLALIVLLGRNLICYINWSLGILSLNFRNDNAVIKTLRALSIKISLNSVLLIGAGQVHIRPIRTHPCFKYYPHNITAFIDRLRSSRCTYRSYKSSIAKSCRNIYKSCQQAPMTNDQLQ